MPRAEASLLQDFLCVPEHVRGHGPSLGAQSSDTLDSVAENKIKFLPIKAKNNQQNWVRLIICGHHHRLGFFIILVGYEILQLN